MSDRAVAEVVDITPGMGSEVANLDLRDLSSFSQHWLADLLARRKVLVFRDQSLSRDQHKAFARVLGELHIHPSNRQVGAKGDPEVFAIRTTENSRYANGDAWHTDVSCEEVPPLASALYVRELPGPSGGDTVFADMTRAFATLSEPIKALIRSLNAVHDGRKDLARYGIELKAGQSYPCATHPIVPVHPDTNEEILFVNPSFTDHILGVSRSESDAILELLWRHVTDDPRLHCRVRWQPGTLTIWDNRSTWHHAVWDYFPSSRYSERVTILETRRPRR
ncbi:MAG: TauD/TfdA family dioxygenase [Pseudomonadaceae bacterium]|nr:TauD/TfdA family dioxygenase [Pseudomonadaceae bacterium]